MFGRRAMRGIELEVDDRDPSARLQGLRERARVRDAIAEVMPDIDDEDTIDRLGAELRIRRRRELCVEIRELLASGALLQVADHVRLDVGGDHAPSWHGARKSHAEVA